MDQHTTLVADAPSAGDETPPPTPARRRSRGAAVLSTLALDRYSGLYGILLIVAFFSLKLPDLFFTEVTLRTGLASVAITGILAIGVLIPTVAGLFDLSFAGVAGLSMVVTVWLSVETTHPEILLAAAALGVSLLVGVANAFLVAYLHLDSFVVTLAMSSVLLGLAALITNSAQLYGVFTPEFTGVGRGSVGPVPYLFLILVVLAGVIWIWLERTAAGRYTLAVGSNPVASRLAGINVRRVQAASLVSCSLVAGLAGVLLASQVGIASTATGPGYLLPTIAAVFLGATQVKGRVNVLGTFIALLLIGAGIKGLQLSGAEPWVTDFFNGTVLLLAITAGTWRTRRAASHA